MKLEWIHARPQQPWRGAVIYCAQEGGGGRPTQQALFIPLLALFTAWGGFLVAHQD